MTRTTLVTGGEVGGGAVPAADGPIAAAHHEHGYSPWRESARGGSREGGG